MTPAPETEARSYDVVVVGTGSGGKVAAQELAATGRSVLAVEATRFGGECPYVACVPAKSLLASAHAGLTWPDALVRRDQASNHRDDTPGRDSLTEAGVEVLRGHAVLDRRDGDRLVLRVGDTEVEAPVVVLGPGSHPVFPPVDGIHDVDAWTSVDALSSDEQPASLVVVGGGAVGCELAQAYAVLGTRVTQLEVEDHLLAQECPWVGELVADQLRDDGVDVRVGVEPVRVGRTDGGVRVELADGDAVEGARLLVAGGRAPSTEGLGLDAVGAATDEKGTLQVDARCRVLGEDGSPVPGLYGVGDATGVSTYTHSANYQARIVTAEVDGRGRDADYRAIPRAVYTDPPVFSVGLTPGTAQEEGVEVDVVSFDIDDVERGTLLAQSVPPPGERTVRGRVQLLLRAEDGVLVGAACVGPEADSWGAELALAVKARLDCALLTDHVRGFPTWSEAVYAALRTHLPC